MNPTKSNSKQLDILGTRKSDQEIFSLVLKQWRQRFAYWSVFAAVPAVLASNLPAARSEGTQKAKPTIPRPAARINEKLALNATKRAWLKRQSEFRLPHQEDNLVKPLSGLDDCPGRVIPGGNYTAAAPFVDSGDTTGANDTVTSMSGYYYDYSAHGPDHVYAFVLTGRGPNPQIQVSTTSGTYRPLIYVLDGGSPGACPTGTGNFGGYPWTVSDSRWTTGSSTATLNSSQLNYLPLNKPLYLFVDSAINDASGAGPYTIRMQDVSIAGEANPIDNTNVFVAQHYRDFLNREPDPLSAEWVKLINGCAPGDTSCDRIHVSEAFFKSDEFGNRGYFIWRFYPVSFPNVPGSDPPGAGHKPSFDEFTSNYWNVSGFLTPAQLETAKAQFALNFTKKPAFIARYDSLSNADFVNTLCNTAGVTLTNQQSLINSLNSGSLTRSQVLRLIVESQEVYDKYYNEAFVVMQYFGYLRRNPDALYFDWVKVLDANPADSRHMIDGFVDSSEYRQRFGP
jgi:hypothetical protein